MQRRFLDTTTELTMPPSYDNNAHDNIINDTTFDTNMIIILAALLCSLILALALNSITRCALRYSRRFSQDTPESVAAARGMKKRDLSQLPVTVYGSGENIPATECPICLGEFEKGDRLRMLPKCNHGFHVRCIDAWLVSHSSCPNCRHSLLEKQHTGDGSPENGGGRRGNDVVVVVEGV